MFTRLSVFYSALSDISSLLILSQYVLPNENTQHHSLLQQLPYASPQVKLLQNVVSSHCPHCLTSTYSSLHYKNDPPPTSMTPEKVMF